MVDLTILPPISYIAAAIGVCIANIFYILTLRETTRNRKVVLTSNLRERSGFALLDIFAVLELCR